MAETPCRIPSCAAAKSSSPSLSWYRTLPANAARNPLRMPPARHQSPACRVVHVRVLFLRGLVTKSLFDPTKSTVCSRFLRGKCTRLIQPRKPCEGRGRGPIETKADFIPLLFSTSSSRGAFCFLLSTIQRKSVKIRLTYPESLTI